MSELRLDRNGLEAISKDDLRKWYKSNRSKLEAIYIKLNNDLTWYSKQTGDYLVAFYQTRIKSQESFVDKVDRIRNNKKSLDEIYKTSTILTIQQIIYDLIGARLVMYFFNDLIDAINYFSDYAPFTIEKIKGYMIKSPDTPMMGRDKKNITKRLKEIEPKFKWDSPPTSYESLHLLVRYQGPDASFGEHAEQYPGEGKTDVATESELGSFPIEIQLRTIMQHTWAQIEHKMNYSLRKAKKKEAIENAPFLEEFHCQKALLNAVEYHQRIIYDEFLDLRRTPIALSNTGSIAIESLELECYNDDDRQTLSDINYKLNTDTIDAIKKLKQFSEYAMEKYGQDILSIIYEIDPIKWRRKRLVMTLLAYALLNSDTKTQQSIINILNIRTKISDMLLYEFIRRVDQYFRRHTNFKDDKNLHTIVSDPLVFYRHAGACIKHGDFKRGIYILEEVIKNNYLELYPQYVSYENMLSEVHIYRRIGEYYFFSYLKSGSSNLDDLINACANMDYAHTLRYNFSDGELEKTERSKILANLVVYYFSRYILQRNPNYDAFHREIELLSNDIEKLLDLSEINDKGKVHAMEAMSIYLYFKGDIKAARKTISECLKLIEAKIRDHRVKNPLFVKMTQNIYDYFHGSMNG